MGAEIGTDAGEEQARGYLNMENRRRPDEEEISHGADGYGNE